MKLGLKGTNRFLTLTILFGALSALLIPAMPLVFAATPGIGLNPQTPVVGGIVTITINPIAVPVTFLQMVMYESGEPTQVIPGSVHPALCFIPLAGGGGDIWELQGAGGLPARITVVSGQVGTTTFGGGVAVIINPGVGGAVTPAGPYNWVNQVTAAADNLNLLTTAGTPYRLGICGYEGGGNASFGNFNSILTQVEVGGEILPINTSALLLAGLGINAFWMLPVLAAIAGASFVVLRHQLTRKNQ